MALPQDDLNQHDIQSLLSSQSMASGLVRMTDLDIDLMSDDSVKQMLMDLRGTNYVPRIRNYSNEQIARFSREEAVQMLFDVRDVLRRHKQERVRDFLEEVKVAGHKLKPLSTPELAGVIQTGTYPTV